MKLRLRRNSVFVPLFSTSDIAFLLLIFIMLVSLINYRKSVNIEFPIAGTAKKVNVERNLEIWVDRAGGFYLNGTPCVFSFVEQGIADAFSENPETRVHIIADRDTPFENVHRVINILQLMQHRLVSFVVKNE